MNCLDCLLVRFIDPELFLPGKFGLMMSTEPEGSLVPVDPSLLEGRDLNQKRRGWCIRMYLSLFTWVKGSDGGSFLRSSGIYHKGKDLNGKPLSLHLKPIHR